MIRRNKEFEFRIQIMYLNSNCVAWIVYFELDGIIIKVCKESIIRNY